MLIEEEEEEEELYGSLSFNLATIDVILSELVIASLNKQYAIDINITVILNYIQSSGK